MAVLLLDGESLVGAPVRDAAAVEEARLLHVLVAVGAHP